MHSNKRLTKEEFIRRSNAIHNGKYNYEKVVYVNNHTKVCIICPIHGEFWQNPAEHLKGSGCKLCGYLSEGKKKCLDKNDFIERAILTHGSDYDYSLVEYKGLNTPIDIVCPKHGVFKMLPKVHLMGCGCHECSGYMRYTTESFIEMAQSKHNGKYDYSKTTYVNSNAPVCIICKEHGEFFQLPSSHLKGCGCKKCGDIYRGKNCRLSIDDFITNANIKHNKKYDYSLVDFVTTKSKIKIICPIHGVFEQLANSHSQGYGCPKCKRSKGEEIIEEFFKSNHIEYITQYKITNENLFCKQKIMLVDFFLPTHNTIIEFNGIQHYVSLGHFGGDSRFEKQKERDYSVKQYCKNHKIKLIEIPYNEFDNIEQILKKELKIK